MIFPNILQESLSSARRNFYYFLLTFRIIVYFSTFFSKYTHKNVKYVCTKTRTQKKKKDRKSIITTHIRNVLKIPRLKNKVCNSWKVSSAA